MNGKALINPRLQTERILNQVKTHYLNSNGILVGGLDSLSGKVLDPRPIHEDLGDTVPFLIYFGEEELAKTQVEAAWNRLLSDNWHFANPRRTRQWLLDAYDWSDLLWGMISWAEYTQEGSDRARVDRMLENWQKLFVLPWGRATGLSTSLGGMPLPISSLQSVGMFPEILVRWCELTGKNEYLDLAREIVEQWAEDPFFKENGLFPKASLRAALGCSVSSFVQPLAQPFISQLSTIRLFKDNTNLIASIMAVYRLTQNPKLEEVVQHWIQGFSTNLLTDAGELRVEWSPKSNLSKIYSIFSFQIIDLLCDGYTLFKDQTMLALARKIANYWVEIQGETGLFPCNLSPKHGLEKVTFSDGETDMSVALLKLAELTGENRYYTVASNCIEGIRKYHYQRFGIADAVNSDTGEVVRSLSKTKFYILSLKVWIALENFGKLNQKQFQELLADR